MKTTEAQFEVRPEGSQNAWAAFDTSFQDFMNMNYFEASNSQDNQAPANFFNGDEAGGNYSTDTFAFNPLDPLQLAFDGAEINGLPFSMNSHVPTETPKAPVRDHADFELDSYSPENVAGIAMPAEDISMEQNFQPMYQMAANGLSMDNLSNQTFMSATSSSDGEPNLMTPPEKTSPISLRPQDSIDRRASITGGITSDFGTFHLQSRQSSQVLYDDSSNAASGRVSPAAPLHQWASQSPPPAAKQDSMAPSLSNRIDLAARRKRPRPAPLVRPDANQRCHSFGPLTSSPKSRKTLLDPTHPVRRVRSGLDVVHGRIQKPSSTTAQLSPHVFEGHFQAAIANSRSPSRCNSNAYQQAPLTPLSAAQTGGCQMEFPIHHSDDGIAQSGSSGQYEEPFDYNSPPITPFRLEQYPTQQVQRLYDSGPPALHGPPQSAPPQKTSFFFGHSPPMQNSHLSHMSWQVPAEVPSNAFTSQSPMAVAQPQYNGIIGQFEQVQTPFTYQSPEVQQPLQVQIPFHGTPQHVYQGSPNHLYTTQAQYPFQLCQPTPLGSFPPNMFEAQATPQPLEIKVELGPSPQGTPQPRKQYTFANSTPDDFSSPRDEAPR